MLVRKSQSRAAFTLIEIMIVMAIIVVLAGVGSVYYFRYIEDANKDAARANLKTLTTAAISYEMRYQERPPSLDALVSPPDGGAPFVDPEVLRDPWGQPFQYSAAGERNGQLKPDIWTTARDGSTIGNWSVRGG